MGTLVAGVCDFDLPVEQQVFVDADGMDGVVGGFCDDVDRDRESGCVADGAVGVRCSAEFTGSIFGHIHHFSTSRLSGRNPVFHPACGLE